MLQEKARESDTTAGKATDLADRLARAETTIAERTKARDLTGNRLFQVGVAILAAQFALIGTLLGLILRK